MIQNAVGALLYFSSSKAGLLTLGEAGFGV